MHFNFFSLWISIWEYVLVGGLNLKEEKWGRIKLSQIWSSDIFWNSAIIRKKSPSLQDGKVNIWDLSLNYYFCIPKACSNSSCCVLTFKKSALKDRYSKSGMAILRNSRFLCNIRYHLLCPVYSVIQWKDESSQGWTEVCNKETKPFLWNISLCFLIFSLVRICEGH